ncbi:MAG: hypothetical protein OXK80_03400 [Bdellovibrionales bacterium]|nr:hypothetical protein [Bdellovibrionales bacterium]
MIKTSILAVLMFTAGTVLGGQSISCTFSGENKGTYTAFFNDEEADDLYHQMGDLQAREEALSRKSDSDTHFYDLCVFTGTQRLCP